MLLILHAALGLIQGMEAEMTEQVAVPVGAGVATQLSEDGKHLALFFETAAKGMVSIVLDEHMLRTTLAVMANAAERMTAKRQLT